VGESSAIRKSETPGEAGQGIYQRTAATRQIARERKETALIAAARLPFQESITGISLFALQRFGVC
jgi:hypothetical protein